MGFQRARSDEQREQRRRSIVEVATTMVAEMPVAEISLNELSRRVGLAKSNVLRYFESREAVLLELLDAELTVWVADLDSALLPVEGDLTRRIAATAEAIAESVATKPTMCDLIHAQAPVLERNVSTQVVLAHKYAVKRQVDILVESIQKVVPELSEWQAYQVVAHTIFMIAGAWPQAVPPPALQAAYDTDPVVAGAQMDFRTLIRDTAALIMTGLLSGTSAAQ